MLLNHIREHPSCLLFIMLATKTSSTPGNFLPYKNAETVTKIQNGARLLIVTESNEVRSHFLDHDHLLAHQISSHSRSARAVIFMTMRTL